MSDSTPDPKEPASPTDSSHPQQHGSDQNSQAPSTNNNLGEAGGNSPSAPHLYPRSCVTCRRRKVRCDKRHPCSNCTKAGIDCVFPGPGRAPRKSKKPPDSELLARLRRLEGVVQNLGASVDEDGNAHSLTVGEGGTRHPSSEEQPNVYCDADPKKHSKKVGKEFGRLVVDDGRSRYVSNQFWASLSDEVAEMRDILDEPSSDDDDYPSPDQSGSGVSHHSNPHHQGFIFGYSSLSTHLRDKHPTPTQVFTLWEIYKENVDPVVKILHRPVMRRWLLDASGNFDSLSRTHEAMLFAIYHSAVTSLSPSQCQSLLGEDRDALLAKYRFAVEQSLARANFLNSASMMLLQAFVLFLICVRRQDDTRFVWTLSGLAIRLAQALGIHRDGSNFGLTPFETEMRRRLWWHICILDVRSSEDHGTDPSIFEQFYDCKLPLNINDEDISPETTEPPTERIGCTEMTFCLIRFEVSVTVRRLSYSPPGAGPCQDRSMSQTLEDKEQLIDALHKRLEERYLQYCDMSVPIYWVTATVARLIMAKMWLVVHHPLQRKDRGANLPQGIRDRLFLTSIEVIEFSRLLETHESTEKWGWLFRTYMQWHAVAFVLSELCIRPRSPPVERAWQAVESVTYDDWDTTTSGMRRGMLWRPMRKLMAKARAVRAAQARKNMAKLGGAMFPQDGRLGPKWPDPNTKSVNTAYPPIGPTFEALGMDLTIDPAESPSGTGTPGRSTAQLPKPQTTPVGSKLPLSKQTPARTTTPSQSATINNNNNNNRLDLTPAIRNFTDDDINQWLVNEPNVSASGLQNYKNVISSNKPQRPGMTADSLNMTDPLLLNNPNNNGQPPPNAEVEAMEMDWTGWDQAVRDFQMDMQQAEQMRNSDQNGTGGSQGGADYDMIFGGMETGLGLEGTPLINVPTMTDITDWW